MPILQELLTDLLQRHADAGDDHEKLEPLLHEYNNLCNQYHKEPSILFSIATIFLQRGWHGLAIGLYRYVLNENTDSKKQPQIWNNLGTAYKGEHIDFEAERCWLKALKLVDEEEEPTLAGEYHSNLATLHINNGDPEKGYEHIKRSCELIPNNQKAWWNRSLIELELGMYEDAFELYDIGIATGDRLARWVDQIPYYNGQDLRGKKVLIYGEQGLGDEIMFASAIPELVNAVTFQGNVVYECHDRLESLMKNTFPNLDIYPTRKKPETDTNLDPTKFDYMMGLGSLFRWFGVKKRAPYLKPSPQLVDHYKHKLARLGGGLKVGIGYAGGHKKTHAHTRSFKLSTLDPILSVKDCEFVSLQYTEEATAKFSNHLMNTGHKVHHWPEILYRGEDIGDNYEHTVALIAALDVCVLPNTTAVHVCGAVGTECMSLTPKACAWRYLGEDHNMTMYDNHVWLYREGDDWVDRVQEIAAEITVRKPRDRAHG